MTFHPNSFSHGPLYAHHNFTTRFANNWALTVSLPPAGCALLEADPLRLIEVSVMSGQKLLEFDSFGNTTALIGCDMYADLILTVRRMPAYDPNLNCDYTPDGYLTVLRFPASEFPTRRLQTEVAAGIQWIREIVSVSPSASPSASREADQIIHFKP